MAEDIWSGIMQGMQAARAERQQDTENQQAEADALAKRIAQQHTDDLAQKGMLLQQQRADTESAAQKATQANQEATQAGKDKDRADKESVQAFKAEQFARSLSRGMQNKIGDAVKYSMSPAGGGMPYGKALRIAMETYSGKGIDDLTPGDIANFDNAPQTLGQAVGAPQIPGAGPQIPGAGPGPAPPNPLSGPGLMGALQQQIERGPAVPTQGQPQTGQQPASPGAPSGAAGAPSGAAGAPSGAAGAPSGAAGAPPAGVTTTAPAGGNMADYQAPAAVAALQQKQAQADLLRARTLTEDNLRSGKIDLQQSRTSLNGAMEHWLKESTAPRIAEIAASTGLKDAETAYKDWLPSHMANVEAFNEAFKLDHETWQRDFDKQKLTLERDKTNQAARASLARQMPDMRKRMDDIEKQADVLRKEANKILPFALVTGSRGAAIPPDPNAMPEAYRNFQNMHTFALGRATAINDELDQLSAKYKATSDQMKATRGLLQQNTSVMKDNSRTNQAATARLRAAASKAAVAPVPGPGQTRGGFKTVPLPKAAPGAAVDDGKRYLIGGKVYTTPQLMQLSPEAAQKLRDQYHREHPGGR